MKKIHGNKVALIKPILPETKTYISDELKKQMENELIKQYDRLKIYAVGDTVTEHKVGDEVLVDPNSLRSALVINIEGTEVLIINSMNIVMTW